MSGKLENKVAVITGGNSGIGLATAQLFAEQGAKVAITGRRPDVVNQQKALPYLRDGASIVLTSSVVAEKGVPNHSIYSATKAAVRSLARSLSAELLDRKIRVNVLTPGPVDTPVFESITATKDEAEAAKAAMGQFAPVKRIGSAEELAEATLFLASDASAFMVGSELLIDGGIRSL